MILNYRLVNELGASMEGLHLQLISVSASLLSLGLSQYSLAYPQVKDEHRGGFNAGVVFAYFP